MTDFKTGDRVRAVGSIWGKYEGWAGFVTDDGFKHGGPRVKFDNHPSRWVFDDEWTVELVEAANVAEGATKVVVDIPDDYEPVETEEFVKPAIDATEARESAEQMIQEMFADDEPANDAINPAHYQGFSNGAQVVDITEHLSFCAGNAIKYLARAGKKDPAKHVEDLEKSLWFVQREIQRVKAGN